MKMPWTKAIENHIEKTEMVWGMKFQMMDDKLETLLDKIKKLQDTCDELDADKVEDTTFDRLEERVTTLEENESEGVSGILATALRNAADYIDD